MYWWFYGIVDSLINHLPVFLDSLPVIPMSLLRCSLDREPSFLVSISRISIHIPFTSKFIKRKNNMLTSQCFLVNVPQTVFFFLALSIWDSRRPRAIWSDTSRSGNQIHPNGLDIIQIYSRKKMVVKSRKKTSWIHITSGHISTWRQQP